MTDLTKSAAVLAGHVVTEAGGAAVSVLPGGHRLTDVARGTRSAARTVANVALESVGGGPARRGSHHGGRRWIEVRGLSGPDADAIADEVLGAVRAVPGVTDAVMNRSVARVVVTLAPDAPLDDLSAVIAAAEQRARTHHPRRHRPLTLPCDEEVVAARMMAAVAATAGLTFTVASTWVRLPRLPGIVAVAPTLADHIPAVRRLLVHTLGHEGTDVLLSTLNAASNALGVSTMAAAAEMATRTMLAVEAWDLRQAWCRQEPHMADHCPEGHDPFYGTVDFANGGGEDYANRAGWIGSAAATVIGALSHSATTAAAAALVSAPKPTRAARESFGCALTRGMTTHHDTIVIRPRALRALDRLDAIVIDPRVLYTDEFAVTEVRGVSDAKRTTAWQAADAALQNGGLHPGWHELSSISGRDEAGEFLVSPVRDPFATAVVSEARQSGVHLVSIRDDGLRSLGQGFDTLADNLGSLDESVVRVVSDLRTGGATVLLITTSRMTALHESDVTVGVERDGVPPWGADVFVPDLRAAWRILHAIPVARAVTARGVRLSVSASAIGGLMLIPGVPGYGPDAVNTAVFAALWTGFRAGSRVFADPLPAPDPGHDWHGMSADEVQRLLTRPPAGPEPSEGRSPLLVAPARFAWHATQHGLSLAADLGAAVRSNLADPITPILATGALASALLGSPLDAALVGGVLLTNAALSAQQQVHAERLLRRLLAVEDPPARRRLGSSTDSPSEDVPAAVLQRGDIIEIHAGDVVAADGRLIEAINVEVDESALTGESLPVAKHTDATPGAPLAERSCMVYAGTTAVAGRALAVVTAVGRSTEVRRALALGPTPSRPIGLHSQLAAITSRALPWTLGGGAVVGLVSAMRGTRLREAVASAVAVGVAAVPEGLPLVATLAQLAAARTLSGKHVLIRNPNSIEALARLEVICFDKTGTLSENRLRVKLVHPMTGHRADTVLAAAVSTVVVHDGKSGHATDEAIREAAAHVGTEPCDAVLPFQSGRPFSAALTGNRLTIKGAPEVISAATGDQDVELDSTVEKMAAAGLRVLAVAERILTASQATEAAADKTTMEQLCGTDLRPIGLIGLADTAREASGNLLNELDNRGIGVRLITGDHPVTAAVIAKELGLAVGPPDVITGPEWESLAADERVEAVNDRRVFARMSPQHKVEVVQTLERSGLITAMVGDGANDAAAIRAASVGIGVASAGSDPARTAADILLLNGRIEALLTALDEGQQLWRRVQSAVSVLLGGNAGEVAFAVITALMTGRSVLNARQMLLVNMLTDALPAAALAVSQQARDHQLEHEEAAMWRAIAVRGTATTTGATLSWLMARLTGPPRRAATIALIGLVCTQLAQTLADSHSPAVVSTATGSVAVLAAIISTPGLSQLFGCTPVDPLGWGQAFAATAVAMGVSFAAPWVIARLTAARASVLDDDDAQSDKCRVDFPDHRGEQPRPDVEEDIGSGNAGFVNHNNTQDCASNHIGSMK